MITQNSEDSQQYCMAYFDNEKDQKPKGHIDFLSITDVSLVKEKQFIISYPGREFHFKAKTKEECQLWVKYLIILQKWHSENFSVQRT